MSRSPEESRPTLFEGETRGVRPEFPFEYIGGGYFRRKGVPKGEVAETLHGQQVVDAMHALYAAAHREWEMKEPHPSDEAIAAAESAAPDVRAMLRAAYATDASRIKQWVGARLAALVATAESK